MTKIRAALILMAAIGIPSIFGHLLFAADQAVIIGLNPGSHLSRQNVERVLGVGAEAQSEFSQKYLASINAIAAKVSAEQLQTLSQDPEVAFIAPDGLIATPEWWAARGPASQTAKPQQFQYATTPVEFYSWGAERIGVPAVHRRSPRSVDQARTSGLPLALLFSLGLVGGWRLLAATGPSPRRSRRSMLVLIGLVGTAFSISGCTLAWVLPHPGIMGESVEVALLDTGIDPNHSDLRDNYRGGVDFVHGDYDPFDDNGHGTGVAGIAAASENGYGLIGVAPKLGIWSVKMLRFDEQGSISDLIRGIEWAVERGVRIIGMSLGTEDDNRALREAIQAASRSGVLLVAAAGNKGDKVLYPAAYPEVIAVGATNQEDGRAWFSNLGPEVDLTAPGTDLLTAAPGGGYQTVSGTSFAVPHVVGVAALLMSVGVTDVAEVTRLMSATAEDLGLELSAQGHGMVNAERAISGAGR